MQVGDLAPDFTAPGVDRAPMRLSALNAQRAVLLVFFPFAFSRICTSELGAVAADLSTFANDRVQVVAVSTDPSFALRAWADEQGYAFPLLSDFWPHGEIARSYGVFDERAGTAVRGTFLIDVGGRISYRQVNEAGRPRDVAVWEQAVRALPAGR